MKRLVPVLASIACLALSALPALSQEGNAEEGEAVFRKCATCHKVGPDARNFTGPVLNGVIGRPAGTVPEFAYSDLNKAAGANGLVWTEQLIFEYLEDPAEFLKKFLTSKGKQDLAEGTTRMVFKLTDETDRRDVIAYLKRFSPAK
ncbi:MAG TPA: cytochrome c family protein [Hyphomicrobiaceae bacterium]|nr:cytochrome c family protein [Hyphomicrobiaceae bacterium]